LANVIKRKLSGRNILHIDWHPTRPQRAVMTSSARFRVWDAGRRSGKTCGASNELLRKASSYPETECWWVSPYYELSRVGEDETRHWLPKAYIRNQSKSERWIELRNGTRLRFKSADNPDSLIGRGVKFVVVDEAALIPERTWQQALRPTLVDSHGEALFISTPRGMNWFFKMFIWGQQGRAGYESWKTPTWESERVDPQEIEDARQDMPEALFNQEFGAEFVEGAGSVFTNVNACVDGQIGAETLEVYREPTGDGGKSYPENLSEQNFVIGVDWGRTIDYTAMIVLQINPRKILHITHLRSISFDLQLQRLIFLCERFKPKICALEANPGTMNDPLAEQASKLLPARTRLERFVTTNSSKANIIEQLALEFERTHITIPAHPALIGELKSFRYELSKSGNYIYAAPEGWNDDLVIALAIANWYAASLSATPITRLIAPPPDYLDQFIKPPAAWRTPTHSFRSFLSARNRP